MRLKHFLDTLAVRDPVLAAALRIVSFRCDGNEDSETAFDRVWKFIAEKFIAESTS